MSGLAPGSQVRMNGRKMVFTSSPPRVSQEGAFLAFWVPSTITISGTKNNNGSFRIIDRWKDYLVFSSAPTPEVMTEADQVIFTVTSIG